MASNPARGGTAHDPMSPGPGSDEARAAGGPPPPSYGYL